MKNPTISVIIPVYNGGEAFRRCLTNLAASRLKPAEVIVVADGDTDGSWLVAQDFGWRVLRLPSCGGPARARNAGARVARGEILFFLDADVVILDNAIEQVLEIFQADKDLAALFGSYDDAPGAANFLSQYKNLFHHYVHQTAGEEASTFWSGCGAIRRHIFLEMGGFNEDYRRPAIEDIELGYRLKQAGHRILLYKPLQVKHLKHWSALSLVKTDFFCRALPWTELILRGRGFINDLNLGYSSRLSVMLVYFMVLLVGIGWFWPAALLLSLLCALMLLLINLRFYSFFLHKRGFLFTLLTIPWHWLYYFYSGLAFVVGLIRSLLGRPIFT